MTPASSMLHAILALAALTLLVAGAQGASRLISMRRLGISLQEGAHVSEFRDRLDPAARRINDNYNHLMEAPTVFYAVTLAIVGLGLASPLLSGCAWVFVALRAMHSLVQSTFNSVAVRAPLYTLSWTALATMIVGALLS